MNELPSVHQELFGHCHVEFQEAQTIIHVLDGSTEERTIALLDDLIKADESIASAIVKEALPDKFSIALNGEIKRSFSTLQCLRKRRLKLSDMERSLD